MLSFGSVLNERGEERLEARARTTGSESGKREERDEKTAIFVCRLLTMLSFCPQSSATNTAKDGREMELSHGAEDAVW